MALIIRYVATQHFIVVTFAINKMFDFKNKNQVYSTFLQKQ